MTARKAGALSMLRVLRCLVAAAGCAGLFVTVPLVSAHMGSPVAAGPSSREDALQHSEPKVHFTLRTHISAPDSLTLC